MELDRRAVLIRSVNNKFIIGPAIAPNSTKDDLRQLAQMWSDDDGVDFLKPALDGNGALSTELDHLRPRATDCRLSTSGNLAVVAK